MTTSSSTVLFPTLSYSTPSNLPIGHAESYNPPKEYILTPDELAKMEDQDPKDRAYNFIPKTHDCLRRVSGTVTATTPLWCAVLRCSVLFISTVHHSVFLDSLHLSSALPKDYLSFPPCFIFIFVTALSLSYNGFPFTATAASYWDQSSINLQFTLNPIYCTPLRS
jgi:BOP1NT (NUC169) domain